MEPRNPPGNDPESPPLRPPARFHRQSKLGPLVGKRTWGGEVGVLGYPGLMDGGGMAAPNFALWSPEGGWVIENEGVAPDVEVENWPPTCTPAAIRSSKKRSRSSSKS
jgi:C-terminal processing protease CtpA/Prc